MRKLKSSKGFTLVEVIVVLVILALLAAIMIPSLTGWIDKAREQKYVADARLIYTAAQSAVSEQYGINADFADGIKFNETGGNGKQYGRVANNMLKTVQDGKTGNDDQKVDAAIAKQVLKYLDSETRSSARYKLTSNTRPVGGQGVFDYYEAKKQPGIVIVYDKTGTVAYVEFGYEHTLVHIDADGLTVTKDGSYSTIANGKN